MSTKDPDLSIIILNYNVKDLLINCLDSVFKNRGKEDNWQIIVVDNGSEDGSVEAVKKKYCNLLSSRVDLMENKSNLGFSAGNNVGVKIAKAPVILFLNPDTVVVDKAISKSLKFLKSNPDIGAVTCRVELPDGRLDYSCHRGFPTPWNTFAYLSGLSKLFPHSSLFSGYAATYLDTKVTHEIDCLTGAFLMVRKIAGEQIGWWDTDYFFNGEDVEFCYNLKQKGWRTYFYADAKVIHYKGSSYVDKKTRIEVVKHGVSAMRIFFMKHFYKNYPPIFRDFILAGIKALEHYRKFKIWVS
ncbi:glycosyltransferase family 2 protein [Candidatus Daviesbacteria bacterium]|nr:glycosyltransferase family 2 protein [Candidatus Daviesbacteria bacterium]